MGGRRCIILNTIPLITNDYNNYLYFRDFDEDKGLSLVKFPDNDQDLSVVSKSSPIVYLLYRPGHYDILYK